MGNQETTPKAYHECHSDKVTALNDKRSQLRNRGIIWLGAGTLSNILIFSSNPQIRRFNIVCLGFSMLSVFNLGYNTRKHITLDNMYVSEINTFHRNQELKKQYPTSSPDYYEGVVNNYAREMNLLTKKELHSWLD